MKTEAVIFDLDGVIVDTARFHFLAWKSLSEELGMFFDEAVNERLKGVSRMRSFEIILEVNNAQDRFTEEEKTALINRKNDLYVSFVKGLTPDDMLPGIAEFIGRAREAGLKTAVASVSRNAPLVLECLGAADKFDYVADSAKVGKSKRAPRRSASRRSAVSASRTRRRGSRRSKPRGCIRSASTSRSRPSSPICTSDRPRSLISIKWFFSRYLSAHLIRVASRPTFPSRGRHWFRDIIILQRSHHYKCIN